MSDPVDPLEETHAEMLRDHETRLRMVERIVQGFVDREHGIMMSLNVESRILLLILACLGAVGTLVTILHALGATP
jgi:hypothetical protein